MRNKKLLTVLSVLLALASLFVLSACKKESDNTLKEHHQQRRADGNLDRRRCHT